MPATGLEGSMFRPFPVLLARTAYFALAGVICLGAASANAKPVHLPLDIPHSFIEAMLRSQVYRGPGGTATPLDDGSGCNYLVMREPHVDTNRELLRIRSKAEARVGQAFGGQCLVLLSWTGIVETHQRLVVDKAHPALHLEVVDSRLLTPEGAAARGTDTLWKWTKEQVHPQLEAVSVDLAPPLADLKAMLPLFLTKQSHQQVQTMVESVRFTAVRPTPRGVQADLLLEVPEAASPPERVLPEPALSAEQIARWEAYLDSWDGFFTFVVKHAAADTMASDLHAELLEILLDTRYALAEVFATPARPGFDPVRAIFLDTWERLAPVLQQVAASQPETANTLHYLAFVTSGDALRALDQLGPSVGLDVSLEGLRRFARVMAPEDTADPLAADLDVDVELRRRFGFGAPLPPPEQNPDDLDLLNWLIPPAWGAEIMDKATLKRLNSWAPNYKDIDSYLPLARDLLRKTSEQTARERQLNTQYHGLFNTMVLATAWQESCWRQYVKRAGKLRALRSPSGSVGIMQVNARVWRGFYDVKGLRGDIAYNARAGTEILLHYLVDHAIKKGEHTKTKKVENLARASYGAYNGGPRELTRYRSAKSTAREKRVDADFWDKFQKIRNGNELAVSQCFGDS